MSVGAVQVLNVQNKPALISLSTKYGDQYDSTLSDVTWTMQESITAADDNFTAVVSIHSMIFNNSFSNIVTDVNDRLKVLSTFTVNGALDYNIIDIIVPPGQYNVDSLVAYLNTSCNNLNIFYYGLGVNGNSTYPGFEVDPDNLRVIMYSPTAGTTGVLGTYNASHVYTGFYLIADAVTTPLLNTLGLLEIRADGTPANTTRINATNTLAYQCIGFTVLNGGANSKYSLQPVYITPTSLEQVQLMAVNTTELQGPGALSVSWEVATSNARESYNHLSTGNTIAIVPVTGSYGYRCVYEPNNPFKCIIPNFNVNQFHITIRDCETGNYVDFQGSDWVLNLVIEFFEMDNVHKSEQANEGYYRNVMPNMHNSVLNHTLPNSGTTGYQKKRNRSNYYESSEAGYFKPYE